MYNTHDEIKKRMQSYYPMEVYRIMDIKAIVETFSKYVYEFDLGYQSTFNDTSLLTMGEERTKQWEQALGIVPLKDSTLQDRREVVIARLKGVGKLNTQSINAIVKTFTGGYANSWFKDSTLYVEVTPPPNDKSYRFENVENELKRRVPAHLQIKVTRNYYEWGEVMRDGYTWGKVKTDFVDWNDLKWHSEYTENAKSQEASVKK